MEQRQLLSAAPILAAPVTYPVRGGQGFPIYSEQNASPIGGDGKVEVFTAYNTTGAPEGSGLPQKVEGTIDLYAPNSDGSFPNNPGTAAGDNPFQHNLGGENLTGTGSNNVLLGYTVADLNGDGIPDVALIKGGYTVVNGNAPNGYADYGPLVRILIGSTGSYNANGVYSPGPLSTTQLFSLSNKAALRPTSISAGDVTGDGAPDLVIGYFYNNSVAVFQSNAGGGTFQDTQPMPQIPVGNGPTSVIANVDLNGDAKADLVVADNNNGAGYVSVLLSVGNGSFLPRQKYSLVPAYTAIGSGQRILTDETRVYPTALKVGDINGDGVPDIVAGVETVFHTEKTVFEGHNTTKNFYYTYVTGSIDIFAGNASSHNGPSVTPNGNGTFKPAQVEFLGTGSYPISIATFEEIQTKINNSGSTYTTNVDVFPDLNGDGIPDLAVAEVNVLTNSTSPQTNGGEIAILAGTGDGNFVSTPVVYSQSYTPTAITAFNVTGDGREGLAVSETGASQPNSKAVYAADLVVFQNINPYQPGITLSNGDLIVDGTLGADTINITSSEATGLGSGTSPTVLVQVNGVTETFLQSNIGSIQINGKQGNDSITIGADVPAASVDGGQGNDTITAVNAADDTLTGGIGNDSVTDVGADSTFGSGNDSIIAGTGNSTLIAGTGNDTIQAGGGNQVLVGGPGNDSLLGGPGSDTIFAYSPTIFAGLSDTGVDTIVATQGNDSIIASPGDSIMAGNGNDTVTLL